MPCKVLAYLIVVHSYNTSWEGIGQTGNEGIQNDRRGAAAAVVRIVRYVGENGGEAMGNRRNDKKVLKEKTTYA